MFLKPFKLCIIFEILLLLYCFKNLMDDNCSGFDMFQLLYIQETI